MSKIVLSFVFTMLCNGLRIDIKNMCPRSEKFCVSMNLDPMQSYVLDRNVTHPHEKVTFSSSRMHLIPGNFFFVFPNMRFLTMNRCGIQNLAEPDFMGAENLRRLEMWKNHIKSLPGNLFTGARNLEWLDLSSNRIQSLHPTSFHGLRKLKKLILFRNEISNLPHAVFRDLVSLETIHLEDNQIVALGEDIFATNTRLGIVRIRNNRLRVLHPGIFISMRNLYWLDLSRNFFEEIQTSTLNTLNINNGMVKRCFVNGKVRNLYADNNQIHSLYIRNLTSTQEIRISNNKLHDLSSISMAKYLVRLDVSGNPLGTINALDFAHMEDLLFLNLSTTNLRRLGSNTFTRQTNLAILDLSHNHLMSIPLDILMPLRNLRQLYLNDNQLEALHYSSLRDILPALKELALYGNNWKCAYLRDFVEYMDRNGMSLIHNIDGDVGGTHNVAGINCTLL